jgi:hypothetical protein
MNQMNQMQFLQNQIIKLQNQINQLLPVNQMNNQIQFLQNKINQLQNQMNQINQMPENPVNQMLFNLLQIDANNLQNVLNQLGMQQMNPINNLNQMNQMNNLNSNFNNFNQQPIFSNNNIPIEPFGIPQNQFFPVFQPQQNTMEEKYYIVIFTFSDGTKVTCKVLADSSIENMFQIFKNKASIELKDYGFIYSGQKLDINSQLKIEELFEVDIAPKILVLTLHPSIKINFDSSSGIKTQVKYYGCLCCDPFWSLLQAYFETIGLDENCLKDLKFIFNGNTLPNDKNEAMKKSSANYGIQPGSIITVIDTKYLIKNNK